MNCTSYFFYIPEGGSLSLYPHIVSRKVFTGVMQYCNSDRTLVLHRSDRLFFHTYIMRFEGIKKVGKYSYIGMSICLNSGYIRDLSRINELFKSFYYSHAYCLFPYLKMGRFVHRKERDFSYYYLNYFIERLRTYFCRKFSEKYVLLRGVGLRSEMTVFLPKISSYKEELRISEYAKTSLRSDLANGKRIVLISEAKNHFPGTELGEFEFNSSESILRNNSCLGNVKAMVALSENLLFRMYRCVGRQKAVLKREAFNWLMYSYKMKNYRACYSLGVCYEAAYGCDGDLHEAYRFYVRGAIRGDKKCCMSASQCSKYLYPRFKGSVISIWWKVYGKLFGK